MVFDLPKIGFERIDPAKIVGSFPHASSAMSDARERVQDLALLRNGKLAAKMTRPNNLLEERRPGGEGGSQGRGGWLANGRDRTSGQTAQRVGASGGVRSEDSRQRAKFATG